MAMDGESISLIYSTRMAKKRSAKIFTEGKLVNEEDYKPLPKSAYDAILGDFDKDGVPNIDDRNPLNKKIKGKIEQVEASKSFHTLLDLKAELDSVMGKSINKLKKVSPADSDLYARTKTPYSIIKKLVDKRLLDKHNPKKGLTDLVGTTVAVEDHDDLIKVRNDIRKGLLGEIIEEEDMYSKPKSGYMAYHYIISVDKIPVEVQLKTKRMKVVSEASHDAYKKGTLDSNYMLKMTKLADKADRGNKKAIEEFAKETKNMSALKKRMDKDVFLRGGRIEKTMKAYGLKSDKDAENTYMQLTPVKGKADICKTKKEFCEGNLGISRTKMPQISSKFNKEFIAEAKKDGVKVSRGTIEAGKLTPTQKEISGVRIKKIVDNMSERDPKDYGIHTFPVIISGDNYLLDGHHRWGTMLFFSPNNKINYIKFHEPIKELLERAHRFKHTVYKEFKKGGSVSSTGEWGVDLKWWM